MKMTKKLLIRAILCVLAVLMLVPSVGVAAVSEKTDEIGYESYTYWYNFTGKNRRVVPTKPMYTVGSVFDAMQLGCTPDSSITDVHVSESGKTYILDGGTSRVIVLNEKYEIESIHPHVLCDDGSKMTFNKAKGIFVDEHENIYIADTYHGRVIKCTADFVFVRNYDIKNTDKKHLIPQGFNYQPVKVAVDKKGYVYILSNGSYYGALLYAPEEEVAEGEERVDNFLGFYGSNDVPATFAQALSTLWDRLFVSNEKRAEMTRSLPYTFEDLWIDDMGFVYTTTGTNNQMGQTAQIKRLNPGGNNILPSDSINFVDDELGKDPINTTDRFQTLTGIAADEQGFIYALDSYYGRIYIYDSECNMVSAFGGGIKAGRQDGTFFQPSAIAYNKGTEAVVITDSSQNTVTVFNITDHGKLIKSAQAKTVKGDYDKAMDEWTDVLEADRNCQMAYAGLAKAYYVMGETESDPATAKVYINKAIELAKQGYDRETYALAFGTLRTEWIRENFTWILLIAVAVLGGLVFLLVYSTKHKMRLVKNEKVHIATTLITHPFENFRDLKEKGLTSIPLCLIVIVLYYIFGVMETTMGGFAFVYFDPSSYNALLVLLKTAGLVVLWTFSNWAVCTLLGGKGKIKEILSVISYSLIPSLIGSVVFIICSNVLVPDEAAFLDVLLTICSMYTVLLLAAGSMVVHDYSFGKFIWTTLLTLLGCGIIVFLIIAVTVLLQQTGGFIGTVYSELLKLF